MVRRMRNVRLVHMHWCIRGVAMLGICKVGSARRSCEDVPTRGQVSENGTLKTKRDPLELCGCSRGRIEQSGMMVPSEMMETSKMIRNRVQIGTMS